MRPQRATILTRSIQEKGTGMSMLDMFLAGGVVLLIVLIVIRQKQRR
ncbi:MAG TPA: hypothetical protein VNM24_13590 [Burkholderiales bacterium]|nr:hypothetical protein [Burkholderiales bacterium]